jgi:hypothetical protein
MDYVASFFDSRSSSWNYAPLRNFNKLSSPVQSHLQKVSDKLQVFSRGFVAMRFLLLLVLRYYMLLHCFGEVFDMEELDFFYMEELDISFKFLGL